MVARSRPRRRVLVLSKSSQCSSRVRSVLSLTWAGQSTSSRSARLRAGGPLSGLGSTLVAGLPTQPQVAPYGRLRHPKEAREFLFFGMPRSTAANTFSLRSFQYGFMAEVSRSDQPLRKPLLAET